MKCTLLKFSLIEYEQNQWHWYIRKIQLRPYYYMAENRDIHVSDETKHIDFNCLWETRSSSLIVLIKIGFLIDLYGCKSEFSNKFCWTFLMLNLNKMCRTVCGIQGKAYL
jgi:hypothetical protein